jgi:hypothetical protein
MTLESIKRSFKAASASVELTSFLIGVETGSTLWAVNLVLSLAAGRVLLQQGRDRNLQSLYDPTWRPSPSAQIESLSLALRCLGPANDAVIIRVWSALQPHPNGPARATGRTKAPSRGSALDLGGARDGHKSVCLLLLSSVGLDRIWSLAGLGGRSHRVIPSGRRDGAARVHRRHFPGAWLRLCISSVLECKCSNFIYLWPEL